MPNTGRIKNLEFLAKALFSSVIPAFKPKASRNPGGSGKNTFLDYGSWAAMTIKTFVFVMVFIVSTIFYIPNSAHASTINIPPNFLKLSSGLVGYWSFDGKDMLNGKALDKSGNGNTGTLVNIATSTFYAVGKIGQAFNFDGVNDYVNAGSANSLDNLATVAISLWVYWHQNSGDLISKDRNNPYGWRLFSAGTNSLSFSVSYSTTALVRTAANNTFPLNKWTHVILVWNGATSTDTTTIKMYKDGIEVNYTGNTTGGTGNRMDDNAAEVYLGVRCPTCGTPLYAKSILDDVRIYNRALSAGEIKQLYNMGGEKIAKTVAPVNNLKSGLVGYWTFDGKDMLNGKALDKSGNGNTGSLINIATSTFYKAGKIGQAFNFDGVNDYVNASNPSAFNNISAITLSVWVYPKANAGSSGSYILNKSSYWASGWSFSYHNDNSIRFGVDYDGASDLIVRSSSSKISANQWSHWILTWDGTLNASGVHIYKNGVEVSYQTTTNGVGNRVSDSSSSVIIGNQSNADRGFPGPLDDVRIYNRALSAGEVKQLYNMGGEKIAKTVAPVNNLKTGLVGYWTFDGKDMLNGAALDKSGHFATGTLMNIATSTFYKAGKIGQAFNFDGVNDKVTTGSDFIAANTTTVSAWIYAKSYGALGAGRIVDNGKFILRLQTSNSNFLVTSDSASTNAVSATNSLSLNKWIHIVVVRTSASTANATFYVNGVLSGTANQNSGTPIAGTTNVIIGNTNYGDRIFNGSIDDVRVYNRALTAGEIKQLYNMGR